MWRCILVSACALVGATIVAPAPAAAAAPCWRQVVDDWFDGSIDGTYAPHCYQDALQHLPADARAYTTAASDIQRALLASIRARRAPDRRTAGSSPGTRSLQSVRRAEPSPIPVRGERPLFERIAGIGGSSGAASLPLPILLVGVLSALLVGAASLSRLGHRWRAHGSSSQPAGRSRRGDSRPS
jgi:hypothetical protein